MTVTIVKRPPEEPLGLADPDKLEHEKLMASFRDLGLERLKLYGDRMDAKIEEAVTAADLDRTIEGASTLTITLRDAARAIVRDDRFTNSRFDVKVDDYWYRLVGVNKNGDDLQLTFEDRLVALARLNNKPLKGYRGEETRAQFVLRMFKEIPPGYPFRFYCPELNVVQPIAGGGSDAAGGRGASGPGGKVGKPRKGTALPVPWKGTTPTSFYGGPNDTGQDNNSPSSGIPNTTPGIAYFGQDASNPNNTLWVVMMDKVTGLAMPLPATDTGPLAADHIDLNYTAVRLFGMRDSNSSYEAHPFLYWPAGRGEAGRARAYKYVYGNKGPTDTPPAKASAASADNAPPKASTASQKSDFQPGQYSVAKLVDLALYVGLRGDAAAIAASVARCESSGITSNVGDGGDSIGLWQVNMPAHPEYPRGKLMEPVYNAIAMKQISNNGTSWGPWTMFNNGCYKQHMGAAQAAVRRGGSGDTGGADPAPNTSGGTTKPARYAFQRGTEGQREDTWVASGRLMDEVGWRRWISGNTVMVIAEEDIFKMRSRYTLKEEDPAIISIDWDMRLNKKPRTKKTIPKPTDPTNLNVAEMTVQCFIDRWQVPPGTCVDVEDEGPATGKWLVTTVSRSMFSRVGTVTLKKPIKELPEPKAETVTTGGGGTVKSDKASGSPAGSKGTVNVAAGANRAGVSIKPEVMEFVGLMAGIIGRPITITTGTNHCQFVNCASGGLQSEHWTGNAADLGIGANGGMSGGDAMASAALQVCGLSKADADREARRSGDSPPRRTNFGISSSWNGKRVQIGWRTMVGGNHYNHVHVGVS